MGILTYICSNTQVKAKAFLWVGDLILISPIYAENGSVTLVFKKNAKFSPKNRLQSPKILTITLTPDSYKTKTYLGASSSAKIA
jgi:hypothetical protein